MSVTNSFALRIRPIAELAAEDAAWAGAKSVRLGELARLGIPVPEGLCLGSDAYRRFLEETGLDQRVQILLHRKRFEDMRWEGIWDLALRIRNLFLRTPMSPELVAALAGPSLSSARTSRRRTAGSKLRSRPGG